MGERLYFFKDEGVTISPNLFPVSLDLTPHVTTGNVVDVRHEPVSMTAGNGVLIVTGRYLAPLSVRWDTTQDIPIATEIRIRARDFRGVGGVDVDYRLQPETLTPAHRYNLVNRGWRIGDFEQYFTDEGTYPSLNMLWHKGYSRLVDDVTYVNADGKKEWNSDRIAAEPFPNQSAPQGSLIINPFDTTTGFGDFEDAISIASWTYGPGPLSGEWLLTIETTAPHGLGVLDRAFITGHNSVYLWREPEPELSHITFDTDWSFNGNQLTWLGTAGTTITVRVPEPLNFDSWVDQFQTLGSVAQAPDLENPEGYQTDERPPVCSWYAGRVWMAGVAHPELADRVLFSQLITKNEEYGRFFQENDPTNETLNNLIATDGGVLQVSDIGTVMGMLPYQNVLLMFCDNGVWEISGTQGVFTPDNFRIRKITDSECSSPWGFVEAEGRVLFSGTNGVFIIQPDERTGVLYAQSMTEASIQTAWSRIPAERHRVVKMAYDKVNKQVWMLFDSAGEIGTTPPDKYAYRGAFCFDLRLGGWAKFAFPQSLDQGYITGIFATRDTVGCGRFSNLKFTVLTENEFQIMDLCRGTATDDLFRDWTGTEEPGFLLMGPDNLENWSNRRQAPVVHVFSKNTELGRGENIASIRMRSQWDWTDRVETGKWGTDQEVCRKTRMHIPASDEDWNDGYPIIVTRNKVRGRGRALQLLFQTSPGKDAHIHGYAVRYHVTGRV
jgi:hypothetical protein